MPLSEKIQRGLEWLVLALLLVWAWTVRSALPMVGSADPDSWGYLMPALSWLSGHGLRDVAERGWLYSAFIAGALKLTGSFTGYIFIQQLCSLAAVLPMWLAWRTWMGFLPFRHPAAQAACSLVGLLVVAMYLVNPAILAFEIGIRPEALFGLTAFAQLYFILSFCRFRWREPDPHKALVFGAIAFPLAYAMYQLKPSWALAVPLTTLPVFLAIVTPGGPRWGRWLTPLAGGGLIFLTLWLPERVFFIPQDRPKVVLAMTFFTMNADTIRISLAKRLDEGRLPPEKAALVREVLPALDHDLAAAQSPNRTYRVIGFDPDYIMYRASLFPLLSSRHNMSVRQLVDFCYWSYFQAWVDEPGLMLRKVWRQLGHFVLPDSGTFFQKRLDVKKFYKNIPDIFSPNIQDPIAPEILALYRDYLRSTEEPAALGGRITGFRPFLDFSKTLATATPWVFAIFFVTLPVCLLWPRLGDLRFAFLTALLIFAAPAGNALTIALVHALDNSRYRLSYGSLVAFALAAMAICVISAVLRTIPWKSWVNRLPFRRV